MGESYQISDQSEAYYMTFQVMGWADVFTRKDYRDIILQSFIHCRKEKGMLLRAYVIMSNHVHVIMQSSQGDLSGLVRDFKKYTSKQILKAISKNKYKSRRQWLEIIFKYHTKLYERAREVQFWTYENHAVEMNTTDKMQSRLNYIHLNPVRYGLVDKEAEYLYSSARNYYGIKGLIEKDLI